MRHTLVKPDGTTGPSHDFAGLPPVLAASKGRWLPDNPPAFDPDTQKLKVTEPVSPMATEIPYTIKPLGPAQIARIAEEKAAANDLANLKASPFAKQLAGFTNQDLDAYIDANVAEPGARAYLKKLSRVVRALVRRELL